MQIEEYKKAKKKLEAVFKQDLRQLGMDFAMSNNTVQKGDIVTDHIGSILVEEVTYTYPLFSNTPSCVYIGQILKKDKTPTKKKQKRNVHQCSLLQGE